MLTLVILLSFLKTAIVISLLYAGRALLVVNALHARLEEIDKMDNIDRRTFALDCLPSTHGEVILLVLDLSKWSRRSISG